MTKLLEEAFAAAATLSDAEQDLLASRLLAEIAHEDDFDRRICQTSERLTGMAAEAVAQHRAGETQEIEPERL